jgi:hypothetical protein
VALYPKHDFSTKVTQLVLNFACTIDVENLFGKSEAVGDSLEEEITTEESIDNEESIEKKIEPNKKKSKYTLKLILKIASFKQQKVSEAA